jgi:HK97 gp10 family phage protein
MGVGAVLYNSSNDLQRDLRRFGAVMDADKKKVLQYAAVPLVQAMQQRAPVGKKLHRRYLNGKQVAMYYPGNLRKSLQVLNKLKRSERLFVGPLKSGSKGTFGKNRFDPYYAGMVERGTRHSRKTPFIEPAVAAAGPQVRRRIELGFQVTIKKFNTR